MDNVLAPYYIEYRLSDVEQFDAEAAFGAFARISVTQARTSVWSFASVTTSRTATTVLASERSDLAPLENDPMALRRQLWTATDSAYKSGEPGARHEKGDVAANTPPTSHSTTSRIRASPNRSSRREARFRSQAVDRDTGESRRRSSAPIRRSNRFRLFFASGA